MSSHGHRGSAAARKTAAYVSFSGRETKLVLLLIRVFYVMLRSFPGTLLKFWTWSSCLSDRATSLQVAMACDAHPVSTEKTMLLYTRIANVSLLACCPAKVFFKIDNHVVETSKTETRIYKQNWPS